MTGLPNAWPAEPARPFPVWVAAEALRRDPVLGALGLAFAAAMLPLALGTLLDPRLFNGVDVWVKPLKFCASLSLYCLTLAWFTGYVAPASRQSRVLRITRAVIVVTALFEIIYITLQAARGEASHFNVGEPFYRRLYTLMGVAAVILTAMQLPLAWAVARRAAAGLHPAFRLSVVIGLVLGAVLGIVTGIAMGGQTSHFVGGLKEAPGLPLVGWSTIGGDWRVAHFFGLHAAQALPLVGLAVAGLRPKAGVALVAAAGIAYTALTLATLMQAAANRPFLAL